MLKKTNFQKYVTPLSALSNTIVYENNAFGVCTENGVVVKTRRGVVSKDEVNITIPFAFETSAVKSAKKEIDFIIAPDGIVNLISEAYKYNCFAPTTSINIASSTKNIGNLNMDGLIVSDKSKVPFLFALGSSSFGVIKLHEKWGYINGEILPDAEYYSLEPKVEVDLINFLKKCKSLNFSVHFADTKEKVIFTNDIFAISVPIIPCKNIVSKLLETIPSSPPNVISLPVEQIASAILPLDSKKSWSVTYDETQKSAKITVSESNSWGSVEGLTPFKSFSIVSPAIKVLLAFCELTESFNFCSSNDNKLLIIRPMEEKISIFIPYNQKGDNYE